MRKSELGFIEGFYTERVKNNNPHKAFDWDKAAEIIKEKLKTNPNLTAEAGLEGDWNYTGGIIFENGQPTTENYTFLESNWATPTLIITLDNGKDESFECFTGVNERFDAKAKWDKISLSILSV